MLNISSRAVASKVLISLQHGNDKEVVITRDKGKGFDLNRRREGIGISNMLYRVNALQGNIQISSQVNAGTSILINFPICR
ncbi:MAG: hypothetical protein ACXWCG_04655 [Flavitalea sp.]